MNQIKIKIKISPGNTDTAGRPKKKKKKNRKEKKQVRRPKRSRDTAPRIPGFVIQPAYAPSHVTQIACPSSCRQMKELVSYLPVLSYDLDLCSSLSFERLVIRIDW